MTDTTFTDTVTLSASSWAQDINNLVYRSLGQGIYSTVASATTPDIFASTIGGVITYTGTATCTGFVAAQAAGARRTLICTAAAVFTAGANMLIAGVASASNFTAAANDEILVIALTTTQFLLIPSRYNGVPVVGTQTSNTVFAGPSSGAAAAPTFRALVAADAPPLRSYLAGLTLSTAGNSATMSIAAGQAADSTNAALLSLAAFTKTTSAWAVGTGNGGIDTGSIANSTWYKFYLIQRVDTGLVDVIFTIAALATGPALPTNYTLFRYIGSGKTDGSAKWTAFTQDGDYFRWSASILDVNTTNPGTSAISSTLTVPTGINVYAIFDAHFASTTDATSDFLYFSDLAATDEAASATAAPLSQMSSNNTMFGEGILTIRTNTSAQIRYRVNVSDGATIVRVATLGWIDYRQRNA